MKSEEEKGEEPRTKAKNRRERTETKNGEWKGREREEKLQWDERNQEKMHGGKMKRK